MNKLKLIIVILLVSCVTAFGQKRKHGIADTIATPKSDKSAPKPSISEKTKSSKKTDGLFTFYQDTLTGSVQLYVKKNQLQTDYIYQSFSLSGLTMFFLNQGMHRANFIFNIKKSYDKLEMVIENTNFYYDPTNAVSKKANIDHPGAIFYSEKIAAEDPDGYLIAVDGLFLSEKLDPVKPGPSSTPSPKDFNLGSLNSSKSKYSEIKSFSDNTSVVVDLEYDNPVPMNWGGKDVTDARYNLVKMQHCFIEIPKNDFVGRKDDPRIGYFTSEIDDLTSNESTPYKDVINRWNLKKKDPTAAISEPVEPLVYWVENTTPGELRSIVKEAGEKWNEAFEKAGFKNAVVMKQMPDDATWDPADIKYNVIRWVSSRYPSYGAIGPSFTNPRTGQIIGSDITVEWASGAGYMPVLDEIYNGIGVSSSKKNAEELMHSFLTPQQKKHWGTCNMASELAMQFATGFTAIESLDDGEKQNAEIKEMHKQFLYYLILHEMGHTLGLNHNMKASQMLSPSELNDKTITRKIGLIGSVMDYPDINISLDRNNQGDYYTTKVGPYDIWAIEYGYTQFNKNDEESGLNKILSRSVDPKLTFGNDADDMRSIGNGIDPRVMVNDLSSDVISYAESQYKLTDVLFTKLKDKLVKPNKSYQSLIRGFMALFNKDRGLALAVANYVGGVQVDRSLPEQGSTKKPFTVTPIAYQKKAIDFLNNNVFAPNSFSNSIDLLPYLQTQRRGFNFFGKPEDPKLPGIILGVQASVLQKIVNPITFLRINSSSLYGNTYSVSSVINDLINGIFIKDLKTDVNIFRQNIQTEFVKTLIDASFGMGGFDNASQSASLYGLKKIKSLLLTAGGLQEQTKAHRAALIFKIDKAFEKK